MLSRSSKQKIKLRALLFGFYHVALHFSLSPHVNYVFFDQIFLTLAWIADRMGEKIRQRSLFFLQDLIFSPTDHKDSQNKVQSYPF